MKFPPKIFLSEFYHSSKKKSAALKLVNARKNFFVRMEHETAVENFSAARKSKSPWKIFQPLVNRNRPQKFFEPPRIRGRHG
ncbi:MAG: hypothetical protein IJR52_03745 [Selenomonadaceae bacterium]|nr:hypothetical protein [Selenomonadaceae bacterium]